MDAATRARADELIYRWRDCQGNPNCSYEISTLVDDLNALLGSPAKAPVLQRVEDDLRRLRPLEALVRRLSTTIARNPARTSKGLRYAHREGWLYLPDDEAELLERYRQPG